MTVHTSPVKEFLSSPAIRIAERRMPPPAAKGGDTALRRRRVLKRVDSELEKGNYKAALDLVKQLKAHPAGLLRGFGAAAPKGHKSAASLDELRLTGRTAMPSMQLAVDAIIRSVKLCLQFQEDETKVSVQDIGKAVDIESYNNSIYEDHQMCIQHEAGHFLVGYMLGVLPRRFKVPSLGDLLQDNFAGGKVEFIGFEFLGHVDVAKMPNKISSKGKISNETLRKFSGIILGGLAAEHLIFGYSELLHSDVQKLDRVLKWLGLTDTEINSKTRQAAETAVLILHRHNEALSRLADAMASGRSVGSCIEAIERALNS